MAGRYDWLFYTILAGLTWGVYVPILNYGAGELGGKANARLLVVLCVGVAYFVIGVLLPLALFMTGQYTWPQASNSGIVFSGLTGVSGAGGAILLILAVSAAYAAGKPKDSLYIPPVVYGLAPVIATLVSSVWIARPGEHDPFRFGFAPPGWKVWAGIFLVSTGIVLVLYYGKVEADARDAARASATPAAPVVDSKQP